MEIIGSHQAQPILLCQRRQSGTASRFFRQLVILQFDEIIVLPESVNVELNHLPGFVHVVIQNGLGQLPSHTSRHGDDPFVIFPKQLMVHPWLMEIPLCPTFRANFHQVLVPFVIFRQKNQMAQLFLLPLGPLKPAAPGHIHFASDNGLNPLGQTFPIQVHRPIHDPMVRNGQGSLPQRLHVRHQILNPARAIKKTVLCMDMKVNKWIHPSSLLFLPLLEITIFSYCIIFSRL